MIAVDEAALSEDEQDADEDENEEDAESVEAQPGSSGSSQLHQSRHVDTSSFT